MTSRTPALQDARAAWLAPPNSSSRWSASIRFHFVLQATRGLSFAPRLAGGGTGVRLLGDDAGCAEEGAPFGIEVRRGVVRDFAPFRARALGERGVGFEFGGLSS
ncbi:hypothetical protein [Anaeromyxobacter oryzisoli]|uniref:hypothetical protein n=1 Tax=Anaeromyxobacter oryzisoli TaxID=2925408 RepID=UPI001F57CD09|nr:hypothetical protein [Anaeromyxobacter sp. SG63]